MNDAGWETTFADWLRGSRLNAEDAVLVFSVGGGDREKAISVNLVHALETVRDAGARVYPESLVEMAATRSESRTRAL